MGGGDLRGMTGGTRRVCQGVHKGMAWPGHQCNDRLRRLGTGKRDLALELEMGVTLARKDLFFSIPILYYHN